MSLLNARPVRYRMPERNPGQQLLQKLRRLNYIIIMILSPSRQGGGAMVDLKINLCGPVIVSRASGDNHESANRRHSSVHSSG